MINRNTIPMDANRQKSIISKILGLEKGVTEEIDDQIAGRTGSADLAQFAKQANKLARTEEVLRKNAYI